MPKSKKQSEKRQSCSVACLCGVRLVTRNLCLVEKKKTTFQVVGMTPLEKSQETVQLRSVGGADQVCELKGLSTFTARLAACFSPSSAQRTCS